MTKDEVRAHIERIGIVPAIRVSSPEDALFAAGEMCKAGIAVAEVTMTVPEALDVVSHLARNSPDLIVGAGTVLDLDTARRCLDAGARFLTSTGLNLAIVELALKESVVVIPGALTPTEVITAWKAGSDFVKVFPCAPMGGPSYIRVLKAPFPNAPLIAAGGVNQKTAADFIHAGAAALGVGAELIPRDAVLERNSAWIAELARRFIAIVKKARLQRMDEDY